VTTVSVLPQFAKLLSFAMKYETGDIKVLWLANNICETSRAVTTLGYARVSTQDQDWRGQTEALRAAGATTDISREGKPRSGRSTAVSEAGSANASAMAGSGPWPLALSSGAIGSFPFENWTVLVGVPAFVFGYARIAFRGTLGEEFHGMVYPDNIDRGYFNSQLGTRSDRRHYYLAHLQISLLSEHRSEPEYPSTRPPAPPAGASSEISSQFAWTNRMVGNHRPRLALQASVAERCSGSRLLKLGKTANAITPAILIS
jgi:hypothetical protein